MHGQQRRAARLDEVHLGEPSRRACGRLARRPHEPFERRDGRVVVERGNRERRERVAKGQRQPTGRHGGPPSRALVPCKRRLEYASTPRVVRGVYTSLATVRHHELDAFGRVHPGVYLRYLAHAAVEASTAAGFDAAWYAAAAAVWLVRRSTFAVLRPATAGEELEIRTWVEDFRRVRSHRRYEVRGLDGTLRLAALTDWVYVDRASGRPRRVPREMEDAFGGTSVTQERDGWHA